MMISFVYSVWLVLLCVNFGTLHATSDEKCMTWALRRIIGSDDITVPDVVRSNMSSPQVQELGPQNGRFCTPGKRGPPGPQGLPGPIGPSGVCDCIPDELVELQRENEVLKEQVNRIRNTSPETFCLLGMKDGTIPDSSFSSTNDGRNAWLRLDRPSSWYARSSLKPGEEWAMVDLGRTRLVTGVVTQGRIDHDQWVTSYKVEHSSNGIKFVDVMNVDGSEMVFSGNADRSTKVLGRFPEAVTTRFIRIYPLTYSGYISMRFDVIDC